jgi:hypothetical protein
VNAGPGSARSPVFCVGEVRLAVAGAFTLATYVHLLPDDMPEPTVMTAVMEGELVSFRRPRLSSIGAGGCPLERPRALCCIAPLMLGFHTADSEGCAGCADFTRLRARGPHPALRARTLLGLVPSLRGDVVRTSHRGRNLLTHWPRNCSASPLAAESAHARCRSLFACGLGSRRGELLACRSGPSLGT